MIEMFLFCGKSKKTGEWITGDLSHAGGDTCIFPLYQTVIGNYDYYKVDPATVGRCTGIRDRNGTLIFEGHVIKLVTADLEEITITCKFGPVYRKIYENELEITGFYFERSNDGRKTFPITCNYLGRHDCEIWEVVGNIHDGTGVAVNET